MKLKQNTERFVVQAIGRVCGSLINHWDEIFPKDNKDKEQVEELRKWYPLNKMKEKEIEEEVKRICMQSVAERYTFALFSIIGEQCEADVGYVSNQELSRLWETACSNQEFTKKIGVSQEQGKTILAITKKTMLEDIFLRPATVQIDDSPYRINHTADGWYLQKVKK